MSKNSPSEPSGRSSLGARESPADPKGRNASVTEDAEEGCAADHDFRSARGNGLRLTFAEGADITCVTKRAD